MDSRTKEVLLWNDLNQHKYNIDKVYSINEEIKAMEECKQQLIHEE